MNIELVSEYKNDVERFCKKRNLLPDDHRNLLTRLMANPSLGDLVPRTGGARKARLKSAHGGQSGGFRVYYYYKAECDILYLLMIYAKNEQDDIPEQRKARLKELIHVLKNTKEK